MQVCLCIILSPPSCERRSHTSNFLTERQSSAHRYHKLGCVAEVVGLPACAWVIAGFGFLDFLPECPRVFRF